MYEFDFKTLLRTLLQRKTQILLNTVISMVVGLALAFSIPKSYKSEIKMVTEAQKSNTLGAMGSLASIAGVNLSQKEDAISPELYPNVLGTNKFIIAMLNQNIVTSQGKKYNSYVEYAKAEERLPWWNAILKEMIAFFSKVIGKENEEVVKLNPRINPTRLTQAEEQLVKSMRNTLACKIDKETDVISITATAQDPYVAKQLVDFASKKLQQFISDYRTSKTRTDLLYYQKLEKQLHQKYQAAQAAYAKFSDSHQDLFLKAYSTKKQIWKTPCSKLTLLTLR